jgi:multicomponent Na+:H+ antiporter subunit F
VTLASSGPLSDVFFGLTVVFVALGVVTLYRVARGPTTHDRVVAVNATGTTTVIIISLVAVILDEPVFLDIAIVYALLNFLMSIAISKFTVERGGVL